MRSPSPIASWAGYVSRRRFRRRRLPRPQKSASRFDPSGMRASRQTMTTAVRAIVPTVVDEPMDFTLVATNPEAMQTPQRLLILWAARKIQAVKQEIEQTEAS
jgi:hypothetical protein